MYSFYPIATEYVHHVGFYLIAAFLSVVIGVSLKAIFDYWDVSKYVSVIAKCLLILFVSYLWSFKWTNQEPIVYSNIPVKGQFVGFNTTVTLESRVTGKTTTTVEVPHQYVVYEVAGEQVLLPATVGKSYPKQVTLYKN